VNSIHFSDPNIVAHVRFDERKGPIGERVLFIEEIQSDWAQQGREKGFGKYHMPDMPFKKTEQWVNLIMRRMFAYATENGFDRIAWTTGEQQNRRYSLSDILSSIDKSEPYNEMG
jgi:hypothetical protein